MWAALQLIFVTEVSLGTSVWMFIVRGIGTTLGCLWGWAAWEALDGQGVVCAVMLCIGIIPSTYVQLGTKYPKAGMVSIISMCVVALSTELGTVPGKSRSYLIRQPVCSSCRRDGHREFLETMDSIHDRGYRGSNR